MSEATMYVTELSQYGKPLGLPREAQTKQVGIVFSALGCPELGKLGCDHDLARYPVILDRVHAEFRRPCTLANGDDCCDFNFYRKGTAPATEHLNK
jgi:hypothetical protein